MLYEIVHNDQDLCWTVKFGGTVLTAVGSWQEAWDYVGECREHDVQVNADCHRYDFKRDHYGM